MIEINEEQKKNLAETNTNLLAKLYEAIKLIEESQNIINNCGVNSYYTTNIDNRLQTCKEYVYMAMAKIRTSEFSEEVETGRLSDQGFF